MEGNLSPNLTDHMSALCCVFNEKRLQAPSGSARQEAPSCAAHNMPMVSCCQHKGTNCKYFARGIYLIFPKAVPREELLFHCNLVMLHSGSHDFGGFFGPSQNQLLEPSFPLYYSTSIVELFHRVDRSNTLIIHRERQVYLQQGKLPVLASTQCRPHHLMTI